ncbi:MAG: DNA polymerase III subunit gamma/tau [Candidatus Poribacteria bacterium]|nr:DNA polymerase III subunit gamma/tau [Candidatus Poribacteria bacterium]
MAYIALSRKWRPQKFSEVVGQTHVVRTLRNGIASERIHHAYLFSGPRGVGKTTMARIFARALNCKNRGENQDPCGECDSCKSIREGNSLDVVEIDAASNNGVDDIRELRENVKLTTVASRYRVYILDEAHMLSAAAWNAFLTTLEEPPPHVIFIFASTEKNRFPATILSRCQQFDFYRMTYEQITSRLRELTSGEARDVDEEALGLIANQSEGCLRDAQSALEQLLAFCPERATAEDASRMLGFGSAAAVDGAVNALASRNALEAFRASEALFSQGADVTQCLRLIGAHFHALLRLKVSPKLADTIQASPSKIEEMREQAAALSIARIQWTLKMLMRAEKEIRLLGYDRENFEICMLDICQLEDDLPLEEALEKLQALEEKMRTGGLNITPPAETPAAPPPVSPGRVAAPAPAASGRESAPPADAPAEAPAAPPSVAASELNEENAEEVWKAASAELRTREPFLWSHLDSAKPSANEGALTLAFNSRIQMNKAKEKKETLQNVVQSVLGKRVEIRLTISEQEMTSRSDSSPQTPRSEEETENERARIVRNLFDGKIELPKEEGERDE